MRFARTKSWLVLWLWAATTIVSSAQTLTTLTSFDENNGAYPYNFGSLIQGLDGNFYGTTWGGGGTCSACGTVFKIAPGGSVTTLHRFLPHSYPLAGLVLSASGEFFGTAMNGGTYGEGAVFKITASGTFRSLYSFCAQTGCPDGSRPTSAPVQALDGKFYGMTTYGGVGASCTTQGGCGTVFRMTPSGTLTTLYSFCSQSNCADGVQPYGGLIQGTDGNFYGTTETTVFKITSNGNLTTLYRFCSQNNCTDGSTSLASLIQGSDGNFFGTTAYGGANGYGTVFKVTASGILTTLYSFCTQENCADGINPYSGLTQGTDGDLYGTTSRDGGTITLSGTLFKITTGGYFTRLYAFCAQNSYCLDGALPQDGLVQGTDGTFYGVTTEGGTLGRGTAFSLNVVLDPFIEALPFASRAGKAIKILGQGLTGTTAVSFNGTPANFSVNSDTFLTATVPTGATTGFVTAATPGGTLTSNKQFRVLR